MADHLVETLGERNCMFIVQVLWDMKLFEPVEFHLEDGHKMAISK